MQHKNNNLYIIISIVVGVFLSYKTQAQTLLSGTRIGAEANISHPISHAFDKKNTTYYQSLTSSKGWVGLDLGSAHVITKIGWMPRSNYSKRCQLAIFEGANNRDFSDAIPLYFIESGGTAGVMNYKDVSVSRAFRYVRYLGPNNSYCWVSGLEFFGYPSEGSDSIFYQATNLPLVVIHVDGNSDPQDKVTELPSHFSIISKDGSKIVEDSGTFRLRGNSSMVFDKKPYRIKFASKHKVAGSPAKAKKWTLIPSHSDKSLMRNILGFYLSRQIGLEYTPFCTPVDVMVNGEYKGNYELCDQIEIKKDRVDITEMDTTDVSGENLTGGYLIEIDGLAHLEPDSTFFRYENPANTIVSSIPVTIKSPGNNDLQKEQYEYIKDYFNTFVNSVISDEFTNQQEGYRKYLDVESFIKLFLVGEISGNTDTFWSTYLYKDRNNDRFFAGPVWDFDIAFENDRRTYPINDKTDWLYASGGSSANDMRNLAHRILEEDPLTVQQTQEMWAQLRANKKMEEDSILLYVDSIKALLNQSQKLNFTRWNILNEKINENFQALGSFDAEVNWVKDYISERFNWIDNKLECQKTQDSIIISEAEWATIYLPTAFIIPDEMQLFSIDGYNEDSLILNQADFAEANKPYLVHAPQGTYYLDGYDTKSYDSGQNGLLTGTNHTIFAPLNSYVLQKQEGKVGFFPVRKTTISVPHGKAYLQLPDIANEAPIRGFVLSPEATGIASVLDTDNTISIYSISGHLLYQREDTDLDLIIEELRSKYREGIYFIVNKGVSKKIVLTNE